jgi:hypothetical protein
MSTYSGIAFRARQRAPHLHSLVQIDSPVQVREEGRNVTFTKMKFLARICRSYFLWIVNSNQFSRKYESGARVD